MFQVRQFITVSYVALIGLCVASSVFAADKPTVTRENFHLYLLIGQSNMAGRGTVESQDKQTNPHLFTLNKSGKWVIAKDPIHFDKSAAGVGPGLSFGKTMANAITKNKSNVKIGLIPCAVGGTKLDQWKPGGYHKQTKSHPYDDAIKRAKLAMKTGMLKGIIWHQGEGDSNEKEAKTYGGRLEGMMHRLRSDLGAGDVPIVVGKLSEFFVTKNPEAANVNHALKYFPLRVYDSLCMTSDGLTHKGDGVHFNAASARELGKRYAKAMLTLHARPKPIEMKVWHSVIPLKNKKDRPEEDHNSRVRFISEPTLRVYLPAQPNGKNSAVVICPGGGYAVNAIDKEGYVLARWFNELGVAAIVLKYRVRPYQHPAQLLDAQQAMRLVRQNAVKWNINPNRIGIMGFSAGGHLAAYTSNMPAHLPKEAASLGIDEKINCKPDFTILIYAVAPQKRGTGRYSQGNYKLLHLNKQTPPAFLAHAKDDYVPVQFAIDYAAALNRFDIASQLVLYEKGGHGYGMGINGGEVAQWPNRLKQWIQKQGYIK